MNLISHKLVCVRGKYLTDLRFIIIKTLFESTFNDFNTPFLERCIFMFLSIYVQLIHTFVGFVCFFYGIDL